MAANTTRIDDIVDDVAITQFNNLQKAGKELRTELSQVLQIAIDLNAALGGSTPAQFTKNLKAAGDATDSLIKKTNQLQDVEAKKAAKQEEIYNKYLVMLSKQEAARQQADAKELQQAEQKAAKLQAIQDKANAEAIRKANVQFPAGSTRPNPVTEEPTNPSVRNEPIITGNEDMQIPINKTTEAIQSENIALAEQTEVLASLSVAQRANLELLLTLQAERAENAAELKALNVEDAASGERAVFLTQRQIELKIAIQQTNLALSQQTKQMLAEDTSGARMQARLDELRIAIGNLSESELANVEIGGVWLAEAEKLDIAIKQLRGSTGDATKNVGAYTTATAIADKVSAQFVRQLVRMAAQFLLITVVFGAISWLYDYIKNLDVFTGRLDQATQNLKAFNEVQKNVANDAGQIVGKYRILTDTINDLTISYDDRLRAATELKKLFPTELEHSTAQAIANGTESASLDKLTDSVIKLAKAKAAASEIEKTEGEIIALQIQRDKVNFAKSNQINESAGRAANLAKAQGLSPSKTATLTSRIQSDIATNAKKQADKANADISAQIKVKEGTIKLLEQYGGLSKEAEAIESKGTLNPKTPKAKDTTNTDLLEFDRIKLAESQKINKAVFDNDENSYDVRKVALDQYLKDSRALLKNSEKIIDADTNLRAQQRINMKLELSNKAKDIDNEAVLERQKLDKDELERHKKLLAALLTADKEYEQEQLEDLNQGAIVAAQQLNDAKDALINAKTEQFAKGRLSEKQFNRDLLAINDEYNVQRIAQELAVQQTILAIKDGTRDASLAEAKGRKATPEELAKIASDANKGIDTTKNKIGDLTNQLGNAKAKQGVDEQNGKNADKEDAKKALAQALEEAKTVTQDINDLIDKGYENQISKLEKVGQKIQENADIEKAAIDRSLDTQSNKARRQLVLDAQTASAQKAIQADIAREKTKQARADKIAAISEIILNTAIAATKVTAQAGLLGLLTGVPAVIALGAIQLAKVVATPIPQFYKGTPPGGHKGGLAIIGELGSEHVKEPGKPAYYSPGVATMVDLPRGTVVTPHNMLPVTPKWESSRSDNTAVVDGLSRIERAVSGQPKQRGARLAGWASEQRLIDAWNSYSTNHFK